MKVVLQAFSYLIAMCAFGMIVFAFIMAVGAIHAMAIRYWQYSLVTVFSIIYLFAWGTIMGNVSERERRKEQEERIKNQRLDYQEDKRNFF